MSRASPFSKVITRFAPSPTGYLHVGGLRTALFSYLLARRHGGEFLVRIEDTDTERTVKGAGGDILESLRWVGLHWDNKVIERQSQRSALYQRAAAQLLESGHAYRCFCSPERLASLREGDGDGAEAPQRRGYDGLCRSVSPRESRARMEAGEPYTVRALLPRDQLATVDDALRGSIVVPYKQIEDMILLKSDGMPTYHLAHVVDDHDMKVSHVMRGSEWISTYPLHAFLWKALGYPQPTYYHLPLLLSPQGGKLSKRHDSVAVNAYQAQGYVAEGMVNFMALLGWAYDDKRTFFTLSELEELFDAAKISKSAAMFNTEVLDHYSQHYIGQLPSSEFLSRAARFLQKQYPEYSFELPSAANTPAASWCGVALLYQSRLITLGELRDHMRFFIMPPTGDPDLAPWQEFLVSPGGGREELLNRLGVIEAVVAEHLSEQPGTTDGGELQKIFRQKGKDHGWKIGQLLMPLRICVVGHSSSPHIAQLVTYLPCAEVLRRIARHKKALSEQATR